MNNKIISIDTLKYYNDKLSNYVDEKVSDAVDNLELDELNAILVDTDAEADDPIVSDYVTETELNTALSNKMDKVTLAKVATSGSYNDLTNKPTIPTAVTESTVSGWGFTKNAGTITGVSINGTTIANNGNVFLPNASTSAYGVTKLSSATNSTSTSLAATASAVKAAYDLANTKVSWLDQDMIYANGFEDESGELYITPSAYAMGYEGTILATQSYVDDAVANAGGGGGSSSGSGAYSEVNHGTSDTTFTLTPNTFHIWDEVANLDLILGNETSGVANEYLFQFTSGSEPTSLILPDDIKWSEELIIESNRIYQVSILRGLASVLSWDNSNLISFSVLWGMSNTLNFECEKGMTWEDFVASSYNTDSALKISNGNIWYNHNMVQNVTPTTIIENGKIYTSIYLD